MPKPKSSEAMKQYRFEFRHVTVLFLILIVFQLVLTFIQKSYLRKYLEDSQHWYQEESGVSLANLASTSLELLLENIDFRPSVDESNRAKIIQAFDMIFSQHSLQQHVDKICLLVSHGDSTIAIDEGRDLYYLVTKRDSELTPVNERYSEALSFYRTHEQELRSNEQIISTVSSGEEFHVYVPFMPKGEFLGVLYMKKSPNLSVLADDIIESYDEAAIIYSSLILIGLIAMYYISTYTVKERDEVQQLLLEEHEEHVKQQIDHEKESLFTKRIYHTHHKAEKVMGFIKEDLRNLSPDNIEEVKARVTRYSNFISRVIYDMKWYDPPVQTIRNPLFRTNLNEVVRFIVDNIFLRLSSRSDMFSFSLNLDDSVPLIIINEFVVWEIIEPIIQNSIDHAGDRTITITIASTYDAEKNVTYLTISDNGKGINDELLKLDERGIAHIFAENVSTKESENKNSGYGCYIAHELAVKRCGWQLHAENNETSGCMFTITIPNAGQGKTI